jgi:glycosyltransferase involved in cell wall biosynthesis
MGLVAIILTYNEEAHIARCIKNLINVVEKIYIVDSYSSDSTVDIAKSFGAKILQHPWSDHANQFNWALENIDKDTTWVLRIDADEYLSDGLKNEIFNKLALVPNNITGISIKRKIIFQGILIKFGGIGSVNIVRIIRYGFGRYENRLMDEHLIVNGQIKKFGGAIIDENIKPLSWWIEKHNSYSNKEAIESLNSEYKFFETNCFDAKNLAFHASAKRFIKNYFYNSLPLRQRALLYFYFRFFIQLGFIDSIRGSSFHFLQAYWYRLMVDLKISEIKAYKNKYKVDIIEAIEKVTGLKINLESLNNNRGAKQ